MTDFVLSESSRDYKKIQKGRESIGEILDAKNMEYIELQKDCNSIKAHIAQHEKDIQMAEFSIQTSRESILQLEEDFKMKNTILKEKKEWMEGIECVLDKAGGRVESASNSPVNSNKKPFIPTSRNSGKRPKKTLAMEKKNTPVTRSPGRKRKEPPTDSTPSTPVTPTRSRSRQTTPNKRQKKNETMETNSQSSYSKIEVNIKGKPQTVLKDSRGRFTKKEKLVEKPDKNDDVEEEEVDEEGNEEEEEVQEDQEEEEEEEEEEPEEEPEEEQEEEEEEEDDDSIVQKKNIRRKKK